MSKNCGTCRHFNPNPIPPGPVDMSQPVQGSCREGPPNTTSIPGGQGQIMLFTSYPNVSDQYPACSRHLSVLDNGQKLPSRLPPLELGK